MVGARPRDRERPARTQHPQRRRAAGDRGGEQPRLKPGAVAFDAPDARPDGGRLAGEIDDEIGLALRGETGERVLADPLGGAAASQTEQQCLDLKQRLGRFEAAARALRQTESDFRAGTPPQPLRQRQMPAPKRSAIHAQVDLHVPSAGS